MSEVMSRRTPEEIEKIFTERGCAVECNTLGTSYRAGGEIFIYAPGVDVSAGLEFIKADFVGFESTGYDGRGRHYDVYLVKAGEYVAATEAEYANASPDKRRMFGAEHRSCSNVVWYVHRDELKSTGRYVCETWFMNYERSGHDERDETCGVV